MNRWHSRVMPRVVFLGPFAALYVLNELVFASQGWKHNLAGGMILVVASTVYGGYRALAFHPFYRSDYLQWLRRTPWNSRQPLPLGPVHLVWVDFTVLSLISLLALRHPVIAAPVPLLAFLLPYVLVLTPTFVVTGVPVFAYGVAIGVGLLVRILAGRNPLTLEASHTPIGTAPSEVIAASLLGVALGLYLVAWIGLKRSLARLHEWPEHRSDSRRKPTVLLGWPFDRLGPQRSELRISTLHALALSALCGWWLFCFAAFPNMKPEDFALLCGGVVGGAALVRLCHYCLGYAAPIGLKGRIATFRWVIPKYDQVFLAPLSALLVGFTGKWLSDALANSFDIGYSVVCALALLVVFTMPPSHEKWRLTGGHRIVSRM